MILHYLKTAFRNISKFKNQTLISVLGLAVGFACFSLATLWVRYEMTFDSFHKNAKNLYVIYKPDVSTQNGYSRDGNGDDRLASHLKETFPEITNAIQLRPPNRFEKITIKGVEIPAMILTVDSTFQTMFDVKILEGNRDFLIPGSNKLAITQKTARRLFGNKNPIGEKINDNEEICAIVADMSGRSNYAFNFIKPFVDSGTNSNTIIELLPGTDIETFKKKLSELKIHLWGEFYYDKMIMRPLTKIRYIDPEIIRNVNFQHIVIFSVSGLLIILCSLFNYFTLFVSRFRIRQKELALRVVCGASGGSLLSMLSVEFMLTLLFAVFLGFCLMQGVFKPFTELSDISMNLPAIYKESLLYLSGVIFVSLLAFWLILFIFRQRSLNLSIRRSNKNLSRKISIVVQLVISMGFTFCTLVIMKQMYFLHHTVEIGFSYHNRGAVMIWEPVLSGIGELANHLRQIPEITEVVDADEMSDLFGQGSSSYPSFDSWDDKPFDTEKMSVHLLRVSPEFISFYDLQLVAGEMLTEEDPDSFVLINESAVNAFGWRSSLNKKINDTFTVKGVIRNIYSSEPTIEAKPVIYKKASDDLFGRLPYDSFLRIALFKYREGMWKSCKEKIEQMVRKEYPNVSYIINNTEDQFDDNLKSENALIRLLSFFSATCVLISIFGFVSLVSLACEERRKSIAIRKINGATSGDILALFAKEFLLLIVIGAAIAFSTGYFIMKRWLEQYVKQTTIPAWVYFSILCVMALILVLCVGWQVYKASIENPAKVVNQDN